MHRKGSPAINRVKLFFLNTLSLFFKTISLLNLLLKSLRIKTYPGATIISIDNLSFGGTGKSPLVLALGKALQEKGHKFAVVTRGYKSTLEKQGAWVNLEHGAHEVGDEAIIFKKHFPQQDIFIGHNRHKSIEDALKRGNTFIILDDGFQSTHIRKDIKIMLFNPLHAYYYLRNFKWLMKREDFILDYSPGYRGEIAKSKFRGHYSFRHQGFCNSKGDSLVLNDEPILGFSALGDNGRFKKDLEHFNLVNFRGFPDHYNFTEKDLEKLDNLRKSDKCAYLVCTEKDFVKLKHHKLAQIPLIYSQNVIEFDLDLIGNILEYAKNKKSNKSKRYN